MTSHWLLSFLVGLCALVVGTFAGYLAWRRALQFHLVGKSSVLACVPLFSGLLGGGAAIVMFLPYLLVPHDRFYSAADVVRVLGAVGLGSALLFAYYFVPRLLAIEHSPLLRGGVHLLFEFLACLIVTLAGIRFNVWSPIPATEIALGNWAWPATILWMLLAMNVVKLLDGLEGAASVVLLVGAIAVFYTTLGTDEHFLNAFAAAVAGASLASLRLTAYPARLSLRGAGSSVAGFLFAVLTVLARQKTIAALLFIFPLGLVVVLIATAALGLLERIFFPDTGEE